MRRSGRRCWRSWGMWRSPWIFMGREFGRKMFRQRARKQGLVDSKRITAIGYCFGGTTVIELARSGADIAGVVSFHGALDSPKPEDGKNIRCKVLALQDRKSVV